MTDFRHARTAMIDSQLRPSGVTDPAVLEAMGAVAREEFVPPAARDVAYIDRAIPLGGGRAVMPPLPLARMLGALAPRRGERALVHSPSCGYAEAVLRHIGLDVDTAEAGDTPAARAYDLVLVDGAVPACPPELAAALAEGGRIALPLIDRGVTRLSVGTASGGNLALRAIADAAVPPLPAMAAPAAFAF